MKCTDNSHTSINLCGHRELAMRIIEGVIEVQLGRGIDGEEYYDWEDALTELIAKDIRFCNGSGEPDKKPRKVK